MSVNQARRHHVTVKLVYLDSGTPWKWLGSCICGWRCMSWQWIAVDRPGGTLPMALEHLAESEETVMPDPIAPEERDDLAVTLLHHRAVGSYRARNKETRERVDVTDCYCGWSGPGYWGHVADAILESGYRKVEQTTS